MRMYTGRGDTGNTDLLGERTAKDDPRIEALGALTAPSAPDLVAASGDGTVTATWTATGGDRSAPG